MYEQYILIVMYSQKNKYNPFLWQQSWHYAKFIYLKKYINKGYNRRSISTLSKSPEHYGKIY